MADVLIAAETGANILVLTTWVDHLNAITDRLQTAGKTVTALSGGMKAHVRRQIADQLANHRAQSCTPFTSGYNVWSASSPKIWAIDPCYDVLRGSSDGQRYAITIIVIL